ncbi:hypothetical protein [Streptomyces sp. NPDC101149]|uniref:hypothetical protein n=1 Tax=Streptomyces sp. NPDC101149 TaxID=3366113 RepID=UPI00381C8836
MQHRSRHPLATHPTSTTLGFRADGRPIYVIAGGNGEGDSGTPPATHPAAPPAAFAPDGDGTDRQAESPKREKCAKENKGAADELATLTASKRSEQERVLAEGQSLGRKAADLQHGRDLAAARFETAAIRASIDLSEAAELIDTTRFVDQDGNVDIDGIAAAVKKLAKIAPKSPGGSSGDRGGPSTSVDHHAGRR